MNGLARINVELTSRCSKSCFMCGRRKLDNTNVEWGDMPIDMVALIARQTPPKPFFVQFHWNGEPLLYPKLGHAFSLF